MFGKVTAGGRAFLRDESGVSTVWALYWTIIFLITAGFVIDASNAYRYRVVLQATADSSALGAIMSYREPEYYQVYMNDTSEPPEEFRGRAVAKKVAATIMGQGQNKIVVGDSQIEFGDWDGATFNTAAAAEDIDAAKITALRTRANGNELKTLLMNMFGGRKSWDVGAVAIAHYYKEICPKKEGIMAGNTLNLSSGNTFTGDLCLHGEQKVDMQSDNSFGDTVGVTYGVDGDACMGQGNCGEDVVIDNNPGLDGQIGPAVNAMPDVPNMFERFKAAVADPLAAVQDDILKEYIPEALVESVDPQTGLPTAVIVDPNATTTPDSYRVTDFNGEPGNGSGVQFEQYLDDPTQWVDSAGVASTKPLQSNTIYEVFGCGGNGTLTFDDDWLTDVVIVTDCRVDFTADAVMSGSTIITSYGDPAYDDPLLSEDLDQKNDYAGSTAFSSSAGATIGTGSCGDPFPNGGSKLISAGNINFSSGVKVNYSQVLSKGNISIAAQGDGTEGTTAWAWGDVNLTSNGAWKGCDFYTGAKNSTIPFYYRLVY